MLSRLGICICLGCGVAAGYAGPPPGPDHSPPRPASVSASPSTTTNDADGRSPTNDIFMKLRKTRPSNALIPSASLLTKGDAGPALTILPEGARVTDLTGTLARAGGWWTLAPVDGPGGPEPLKLLPNTTLEALARNHTRTPAGSVVVSGEITVFDGDNYLLVRSASYAPVVTDEEASKATTSVKSEASAADVLEVLKRQHPQQHVITSDTDAPDGGNTAMPSGAKAILSDGTPLAGRPGRLIADGRWWTFVLESDHPDHPEPPMKLLPNHNAQLMVQSTRRGSAGLVFIVSGEVTEFNGENYLLPRAAIRRIDLGNLRK